MRFDLSGWTAVQPGSDAETYLPSTPETVLWGRLPCGDGLAGAHGRPRHGRDDRHAVATRASSRPGARPARVLRPARGAAAARPRRPRSDRAPRAARSRTDGPHVVTGPIAVRGAEPGDLLRINVLELEPRVPYGVISNRHGRGALPGEYPEGPTPSACSPRSTGDARVGMLPRAAGRTPSRGSRCPVPRHHGRRGGRLATARTPCRPAPSAATSTSTCSSRARRCSCRCRCPARSPTSATRTSPRATARWRSPRWRRRCARPSAST